MINHASNREMVDDRLLIARVLTGELQAFRTMIKQHERLVAHMIGRLIDNREEREELCQDTFIKVYNNLSKFSFDSKLSTWIATIAWRQAINHLRKKKIQVTEISDENAISERFIADTNPALDLEDRELTEIVIKFIDILPPQYKIVVTLYHLEDMTYPEIGEITGMPEGTVKNYLFRARTLLKEKLKNYLGEKEVL